MHMCACNSLYIVPGTKAVSASAPSIMEPKLWPSSVKYGYMSASTHLRRRKYTNSTGAINLILNLCSASFKMSLGEVSKSPV